MPRKKDTEHPSNEQTKPHKPEQPKRRSMKQSRSVEKIEIKSKLPDIMIEGKTTENLFNELAE